MQLFFTHLICCSIKSFKKISHLFNLLPTYSEKILLSVHNDSSPRSFPPSIRGTDKQLNDNSWKCGVGNDFKLQIYSHLFLHVHFIQHNTASKSECVIYVNQHRFNVALSDNECFTLISTTWSTLYAKFILSMFPSNCLCVYSFHTVDPLITEHVISMLRR